MSTSGSKKNKYSLNTKDDFGRIGLKYKRKYFEEKEELEKKEKDSKIVLVLVGVGIRGRLLGSTGPGGRLFFSWKLGVGVFYSGGLLFF